jgi:dimethylglycine dehydrogenase
VAFDKGDFVGRGALLRQREAGVERRLASLVIGLRPDDDLFPRGGEPVYDQGVLVSYLRAAHPGHSVGRTIGLAYLPPDRAAAGRSLEVEILEQRREATVVNDPLFDPEGGRMRS